MTTEIFGKLRVEQHGDTYIVNRTDVGAVSSLTPADFGAFHVFVASSFETEAVGLYYESLGHDGPAARERAAMLAVRLERDGWRRTSAPSPDLSERLRSVYFTITRECDLACSYCYQGLRERAGKVMLLDYAKRTLEKIAAFNPACHVIVTGGEPFRHTDPFAIFDTIDRLGLDFGILCNGTYVDRTVAARLAQYPKLRRVQISLDGMSEEVHAITRGRGNYRKAMDAIDLICEHGIPLVIAPTVHEQNAHEISDIAVLAASRGAFFSPNNLREFPHDENKGKVMLDNETLQRIANESRERVRREFTYEYRKAIELRFKGRSVCSVAEPSAHFICGTGHSLLDIDWNGEVYPCHLLKDRSMILGNIFFQSFDDIFEKSKQIGLRVPSLDIPKCSGCKFNSRCGGGCRAGAFYAYGSLAREDDLCEINYANEFRKLVAEAVTN